MHSQKFHEKKIIQNCTPNDLGLKGILWRGWGGGGVFNFSFFNIFSFKMGLSFRTKKSTPKTFATSPLSCEIRGAGGGEGHQIDRWTAKNCCINDRQILQLHLHVGLAAPPEFCSPGGEAGVEPVQVHRRLAAHPPQPPPPQQNPRQTFPDQTLARVHGQTKRVTFCAAVVRRSFCTAKFTRRGFCSDPSLSRRKPSMKQQICKNKLKQEAPGQTGSQPIAYVCLQFCLFVVLPFCIVLPVCMSVFMSACIVSLPASSSVCLY